MAIKVPIEDYGFNLPSYLREDQFWHIKKNLHLNPFYQMEPTHQTTFDQFQGRIITAGVGLLLVFFLFNSSSDAAGAFAAIICFIEIIYVFKLVLEIANYQSAVNVKKQHFAKMREMIIRSDDYPSFERNFYQKGR